MNAPSESVVVFSAILRPHRSSGAEAARVVIVLLFGIWLVAGLGFLLAGAWPVLPFLGLEVLLLLGAFRLNRHFGNAFEAINLTEQALTVRRVNHWGKKSDVSLPPSWLQVNLDEPPSRQTPLELRSHGRTVVIGDFLLPGERLELARTLRRELTRLTRGRPRL